MSDTPTDDDELGTVEENLGGPQLSPGAAELSAAEEYLKPRLGTRANVEVRGRTAGQPAEEDE
jgi:hypothetical protein